MPLSDCSHQNGSHILSPLPFLLAPLPPEDVSIDYTPILSTLTGSPLQRTPPSPENAGSPRQKLPHQDALDDGLPALALIVHHLNVV